MTIIYYYNHNQYYSYRFLSIFLRYHYYITVISPFCHHPQDHVAGAFALALKSLALYRFQPPYGWRRAAQKMLETGVSAWLGTSGGRIGWS